MKYIFIQVDKILQENNIPLHEGFVYVCSNDLRADLKCPCGCGDIISLNLLTDIRPRWIVKGNSITPSVNRTINCKSHFTITNGGIEWHK